ncbi:MAG: GDP-mannose 4,6-dehydratase, partial [Proteobacteria bacterium]
VEAMWLMLQQETPQDFVIATNDTHTVREFVETAFARADLDWKEFVKLDEKFNRPAEVELLIGDPANAKKIMGWEPKTNFKSLVHMMVDADLNLVESQKNFPTILGV